MPAASAIASIVTPSNPCSVMSPTAIRAISSCVAARRRSASVGDGVGDDTGAGGMGIRVRGYGRNCQIRQIVTGGGEPGRGGAGGGGGGRARGGWGAGGGGGQGPS